MTENYAVRIACENSRFSSLFAAEDSSDHVLKCSLCSSLLDILRTSKFLYLRVYKLLKSHRLKSFKGRTFLFLQFTFRIRASNVVKTWMSYFASSSSYSNTFLVSAFTIS